MVNPINHLKETAKHLSLAILGALLFLLSLWLQKVMIQAFGLAPTLILYAVITFAVYFIGFNRKSVHPILRLKQIGIFTLLYGLALAIGFASGYLLPQEDPQLSPSAFLGILTLVTMEEICFRGLFIRSKDFHKLTQFLAPALVFSLVHFIDHDFHWGMALHIFVGALLLFSFCTPGNISHAIVVHFLFNVGTSLLSLSEKDHADLYFIASTTLVNLYLIYTLNKGPED